MRVRYEQPARAARNHALERRSDNLPALVRLQERFDAAEVLLGRFPLIGRPGRLAGTREWVLSDTPYIFIYRISKGTVVVQDIVSSSQQRH